MAFYKREDDSLLVGPNFVMGPTYNLRAEQRGAYQYPVDGWWWFDTEEEARAVLGLPVTDPKP